VTDGVDVPRIRALCFDLDGTLLDTDDAYIELVVARLRPFRRLFPARAAARWARRLILAAEAPANLLMGLSDRFGLDDWLAPLLVGKVPREELTRRFRLVPGVDATLRRLHEHYPLALVSVREAEPLEALLDAFELRPFFRCVAAARTVRRTKPDPAPIRWAAEQIGVPPETCLMVGDTPVDIRAGRAAGAQTVGVLCGFGERQELERAGADVILETTAELPGVLLD
jgi:HAD superfamily hydrolase (TIGR01509 family)